MMRNVPREWWLAVIMACCGGLLLALAFEPLAWWPLAPAGIALMTPAFLVARLRVALISGAAAGLVFNLIVLRWVSVVGQDAWLVLGTYCALWFGVIAMLTWLVRNLIWWPPIAAAVWVAAEAARSRWPWGGFAWGRVGFSQADAPTAGLAAVGGVALVSFAVVLAGALIACWATGERARPTRAWMLVAALAVIGIGVVVPRPIEGETTAGPAQTVAAVVQGGVPGEGLDAMSERQAVLNNHVAATEQLAREVAAGFVAHPDFVVWPENSSDLDPYASPATTRLITSAVDAIGVPVLVGAVVQVDATPPELMNVGIVWSPGRGPGETYAKQHLVPFGEYVPFRPLLTQAIKRYERVPYDFRPGEGGGVLRLGPALVGDVICFEVADDYIVRDEVRHGARALAVQTNNATYAATAEPAQQLAMTRLRAIEHGRAALVAATSGITAIVAPDGSVVARAEMRESEAIVSAIPLRDTLTPADRFGFAVEPAVLLILLCAAGVLVLRGSSASRARTH